ncbi:MAG TPA: hypothetical protein VH088_15665 [Terriglobales bacterium]|jgi:hypothetical protein|nr:hypothetical protein [Terriglobales bacterium]
MNPDAAAQQTQAFAFGGGAATTVLHPVVLLMMIASLVLMQVLPRKYVIVPFLLSVFFTPLGQQLYVGGVHLLVMRILILGGWLRLLRMKFLSGKRLYVSPFNAIDRFFLLWALCHSAAVILLWWDRGAVVNQVGFIWNAVGGYFLVRALITNPEDIRRVIKVFVIISAVMAVGMTIEQVKHHNFFGDLGGGIDSVSFVRDGRIRSQGGFQHPILAGTFGAVMLPLFYWLWFGGKSKVMALVGVVSGLVMVVTSASSTPFMAIGAGFLALSFWPLRAHMRLFRWGLVMTLVGLHLIMKAPVWFLISHVDLIGASSGYHRAMLIDTFLRHFSDWWLMGTNNTFTWGWDMWDLSNQFVNEGEVGGLATLVLFILVIAWSFARLGKARKASRNSPNRQWFLWFLGAALFSNIVAYFGISYFDQTQIAWYSLLAFVTAATVEALRRPDAPPHGIAGSPESSLLAAPEQNLTKVNAQLA